MKTKKDIWIWVLDVLESPLNQISNPDGAGTFLVNKIEDIIDVVKAEIAVEEERENIKMGTVEPIHRDYDDLTIAFIVGAIEKYADKPELHSELVEYLKEQCLTD